MLLLMMIVICSIGRRIILYIRVVKAEMTGAGGSEFLILAKSRLSILGAPETYKIIQEMKGRDLVGLRYQPVFPFFESADKTAYKTIRGEFVTLDDGSGLVHIAPAFGIEDMEAIKQ